jgi:HSP20 family molecular chaperone IbpA
MSGRSPFDKLSGLEALTEIGRRLSGLGAQVKDAVQDAQENAGKQQGETSSEKRFTIKTPGGPVEGVTQMSFRVGSLTDRMPSQRGQQSPAHGSGAAARAERTAKPAPNLDGTREPLVDCFDEGTTLVVTAELPGVSADHITVSIDGDSLVIEARGSRLYRTRQVLSAAVDPTTLTYDLRNGILEARVAKAVGEKPTKGEAVL